MAATTTSSLNTSITATALVSPSVPPPSTSSSSLPGQETTAQTLTSAAATSHSSSEAVLASIPTPSPSSAPSHIISPTPSSISLTSSSAVHSAASSTSSSQASLRNPSPNNVSTGALAGAIVGCIIGTAALTLLVAFLFLSRRRKGADTGPPGQFPNEKPPQHPPLALGASASASDLYIPHPADDETVRARILTLFDHASLHIDNYYSSGAVVAAAANQHDSASLASYNSPYLPSPIAKTLLAKPGRQRAVLTHVLVRELLQQITPGPAGGFLLPACYASCPQMKQTPETDHALFRWRMLTAYLYQRQQARDEEGHAINRLAERFVDTFTGYANPAHTRAERLRHLKTVATAAAELGRWLFAQPCAFEFVWDSPGRQRQGIVITPRVVKVCDEQGRRLAVPQVMAEETSL